MYCFILPIDLAPRSLLNFFSFISTTATLNQIYIVKIADEQSKIHFYILGIHIIKKHFLEVNRCTVCNSRPATPSLSAISL